MTVITLSKDDIASCLPHRGEMLFVRSVRILDATRFEGTASWHRDLAAIQGHFPGMPIVPAVYVVEAAAQVAGAALRRLMGPNASAKTGVLALIRRCAFRAPIGPGQLLRYELVVEHATGDFVAIGGRALQGEDLVAELSFALAQTDSHRVGAVGSP